MTTTTDLAKLIEALIHDVVQRQVDAALAERETAKVPEQRQQPDPPQRWLSTREAAERAGLHFRTIADACRSGKLLATQRGVNGQWRISPMAVDAWVSGSVDMPPRDLLVRTTVESHDTEVPRYLDTAGAAAYAGRSRDAILKACQSGALFATQRVKGGGWSIRPASVDAWLSGVPDPHREQVERWKRGPKQPLRPRKARRAPAPQTDPDGPAAA